MRYSSLSFSLFLVTMSAQAQHYRVVEADDLKSMSDFRIGSTCESIKMQLESRDAKTFPRLPFVCKRQGYRSVKAYGYVSNTTLVISITPENIVWKIGVYAQFPENARQSNADAMQMFYEKFGRPVLEEDISLGVIIPTFDELNSFGKVVLKNAWATSHLNPAATINTVTRLHCKNQPQMSHSCLFKDLEVSNQNWGKQLAKLDGVVVTGNFEPSQSGMASFSIETYQKDHLDKFMHEIGSIK